MNRPIIIGAVLRVEHIEECLSDDARHITLRSYQGSQFEMTVDENLEAESRFRIGDYWATCTVVGAEHGWGLVEVDEETNAALRKKDFAIRTVHLRQDAEAMQEEAREVMEVVRSLPTEYTQGYGTEPVPPKPVFAPGIICTWADNRAFHPFKLLHRVEGEAGQWVIKCLDHGHFGVVAEADLRHATPEETANLVQKGGDA